MLRAYKYRIYPTDEQKVLFAKTFGCCRLVYNWALNLKDRPLCSKLEDLRQMRPCVQRIEIERAQLDMPGMWYTSRPGLQCRLQHQGIWLESPTHGAWESQACGLSSCG